KLSTACRTADLALLSSAALVRDADGVRLQMTGPRKTTRPGANFPSILLTGYTDHTLCPVATLDCYLAKTASMRTLPDLFILLRSPHTPAHRVSISRWVKEGLRAAGVDVGR